MVSGLFLFVFTGEYNILDSGFATIKPFFNMAPWIFIFLIPAISMKSFSEEQKLGTMELLLTKPLSIAKLIFGKYLGALLLVILAIVPSVIYVICISELGRTPGNFDLGATLGSYLGLLNSVTRRSKNTSRGSNSLWLSITLNAKRSKAKLTTNRRILRISIG